MVNTVTIFTIIFAICYLWYNLFKRDRDGKTAESIDIIADGVLLIAIAICGVGIEISLKQDTKKVKKNNTDNIYN